MGLYPSTDPNSDKYPERTFYGGAWRTTEQIERIREKSRVKNMTPEYAQHKRKLKNARYRDRSDNDPEWREKRRRRGRIENMTPEQITRKNERNRNRYWSDPEFREANNKRTGKLAFEKRRNDPWFSLRATQAGREWRAKKREEKLRGEWSNTRTGRCSLSSSRRGESVDWKVRTPSEEKGRKYRPGGDD